MDIRRFSSEHQNWIIHQDQVLNGSLGVLQRQPTSTAASIVTSSAKNGYIKIQVTDNGRGMDANNINKLFEMFNEGQNTQNFTSAGTSLGLWVCKQLCQRMNGDIKGFSTLHRGATFVFYIPVDNAPINRSSLNNPSSNIHPRPHGKITSLVVDDYPFNRDSS